MEKSIIQLVGHDLRHRNILSLVNSNEKYVEYKLVTPYSGILKRFSVIANHDKITWIDPSGGPRMEIGYKVNDLELVEIYHSKKLKAYILKFKRI